MSATLYVTTAVDLDRRGHAAGAGGIALRAGELTVRSGLTIGIDSGSPLTIAQGRPGARILRVLPGAWTAAITIARGRGPRECSP